MTVSPMASAAFMKTVAIVGVALFTGVGSQDYDIFLPFDRFCPWRWICLLLSRIHPKYGISARTLISAVL